MNSCTPTATPVQAPQPFTLRNFLRDHILRNDENGNSLHLASLEMDCDSTFNQELLQV